MTHNRDLVLIRKLCGMGLPAQTLAWWQAPPDGVWHFVPQDATDQPLRAWWMGAMPLDPS